MSNYKSQIILCSNQQLEESELTSSCVGAKKNSKKSKDKTKKNKISSRTTKMTSKRNKTEETEHILEDLTPGERNLLRESEQQIQAGISDGCNNVEQNNIR